MNHTMTTTYLRTKDFFWCSECGHSRQMYNILSIGRASVFVMPCLRVQVQVMGHTRG